VLSKELLDLVQFSIRGLFPILDLFLILFPVVVVVPDHLAWMTALFLAIADLLGILFLVPDRTVRSRNAKDTKTPIPRRTLTGGRSVLSKSGHLL
jgi:hypothetical protein